MRLGVLIIGSLYWDASRVRCRWRQERLSCSETRRVKAPIRYGKKSSTRGDTYTMVFSRLCSDPARLGTAIVVPARHECCEPDHLFAEAQQLWAAERGKEEIDGFSSRWGCVCVLKRPEVPDNDKIVQAWKSRVAELGREYPSLPAAKGEDPVLDASGLVLFDWPHDYETGAALTGFDLLLMTANRPTLEAGAYAAPSVIANAWRRDRAGNVLYFYNNRNSGITTFEDDQIETVLRGDSPSLSARPSGA